MPVTMGEAEGGGSIAPPPGVSVIVAWSVWSRVRGLLARPEPLPGSGLLIPRCSSVHTVGMAYPIDIAFLDKRMTVVAIHERVPPGRLRISQRGAAFALELRAGDAERLRLTLGQPFSVLLAPNREDLRSHVGT